MEEDFEDKSGDDESAEHHLKLEAACRRIVDIVPAPSVEMDTLTVVACLCLILMMSRIVCRDITVLMIFCIADFNRVRFRPIQARGETINE